jgi:hypothetical protein
VAHLLLDNSCGSFWSPLMSLFVLLDSFHRDFFNGMDSVVIGVLKCLTSLFPYFFSLFFLLIVIYVNPFNNLREL